MAKTKLERIASIEEEIFQLTNQKKQLQQQHNAEERKARNHRLCKRGGLWESLLPDTITLTDEQFKIFLEKTITTEYARKILSELKAQVETTTTPKPTETAAHTITTTTAQSADNAQGERA